ncbi:MAG TPA: ATP-binding protein [Actinomycetota bacterium]|nr:ATP-binding protein [Actinomycetota bacterium]
MIRRFPAEPAALGEIRQFVRSKAAGATLGRERAEELALAVSEACTNVIRHTETDEIRLAYEVDDSCLVVEVADEGVFQDRLPVPAVEPGGRGILLMTAFVDEVAIQEGTPSRPGTVVRLVKCKPGRTLDGRP